MSIFIALTEPKADEVEGEILQQMQSGCCDS